jgi:hypothetical protein
LQLVAASTLSSFTKSSSMMQSALWQASTRTDLPNHADLLRLNKLRLTLSYPGWQDDFIDAERALLIHAEDLEDLHFFKMEEKQRMLNGDRSHERLQRLDSHTFSYPGWQLDVRKAEEGHVLHKSGCCFDQCLQGMLNKERVHNGDRSHPDLVQLDRLKRALSYPGWEHDFVNAEKSHLTRPDDFEDCFIFKLIEKQRMHYGDRSHVRLLELDSHTWTYPGWEIDKRIAEEEHVMHKRSPWFDRILQAMKNRQRIYNLVQRRSMAAHVAATSDSSNEGGRAQSNPELTNCVICLTEPRSHAFIPCGHLCACETCSFEAFGRSGICPICRQESDTVMQIFFS